MNNNRILITASVIFVILMIIAMIIAADAIRLAVGTVATPTAIALAVLACLVLGGTGGAVFLRLYHVAGIAGAQKRRANAQALLVEARARRERRAASAVVIVDANKQVFKPTFDTDDNMTDIRRVDLPGLPGVNGGPVELTPFQERMLFKWHALHNTASVSPGNWEVVEPAQLAAGPPQLPPLLPKLIGAQRLIIAGGSDAGKTTLVKHIVAGRIDHSRIIPIDPHAPSKILGFDVIGAGRDYDAIADALESLVLLMTSRYQDVKSGILGYGQHERVSVFIDEWTGIVRNINQAGELLTILLTESRKVNIHLTLCCHSITIDALGLPDAQIRKSATIVEITGGDGSPRRAFIHPASKTDPDGSRAKPKEYALPGPFAGYVQAPAEVIRELPDSKILKAQMMAAAGESPTAIAAVYHDVDKPNGRQIKEVRELLERATTARNGHADSTT